MLTAPFKVVLDANVIFPSALRDTLLRSAEAGLCQLYWTEQILDEAARNLVGLGKMTSEQAARLLQRLRDAFPEAMVDGYETLIDAMPKSSSVKPLRSEDRR